MSIPLKVTYGFNIIPVKIPARIFVDIDKIILKFIRKGKEIRQAKTIFKKKYESNQFTQF